MVWFVSKASIFMSLNIYLLEPYIFFDCHNIWIFIYLCLNVNYFFVLELFPLLCPFLQSLGGFKYCVNLTLWFIILISSLPHTAFSLKGWIYKKNLTTTKSEYERAIWYNNMACLLKEEHDRIQIKHYGTYQWISTKDSQLVNFDSR